MSIDVVDLRNKVEKLEEKNAIIKQENKDLKVELKLQKVENKELIKKCENLRNLMNSHILILRFSWKIKIMNANTWNSNLKKFFNVINVT